MKITRTLLRFLLILALIGNQSAIAAHSFDLHTHGMPGVAATVTGAHHAPHATQHLIAQQVNSCHSNDIHSAACGACCTLSVACDVVAASLPLSLPMEPMQSAFLQPDLAVLLDPPRA